MSVAVIIFSFISSMYLVKVYRSFAVAKGYVDRPNARSSHKDIIPRGGGLVFVCLWLLVSLFISWWWAITDIGFFAIVTGGGSIGLLGYLDDLWNLSARLRLSIHFLVGGFCVAAIGNLEVADFIGAELPWLLVGLLFLTICVAWSVNLFNFMDGMDGIASIEALFVFGIGGLFFYASDFTGLALVCWALLASVAGFLAWNWPKAVIFMGDVGSCFLGLLIALFAIYSDRQGIPLVLWLILYGAFLADASMTLARRILRGEKWHAAHKSHAYQRLHHIAGWSHKKVLTALISLNTMLGTIAIFAFYAKEFLHVAVMLAVALLLAAYLVIERIAPPERST